MFAGIGGICWAFKENGCKLIPSTELRMQVNVVCLMTFMM